MNNRFPVVSLIAFVILVLAAAYIATAQLPEIRKTMYGDANCDGMVTSADAAIILRSLVELAQLTPRGMLHADVDGDGEITAADAAMILRYIVMLIDSFPAENP